MSFPSYDLTQLIQLMGGQIPIEALPGSSDELNRAYMQALVQRGQTSVGNATQLLGQQQTNQLRFAELMGNQAGAPTDAATRWRAELEAQQAVQNQRLQQEYYQLMGANQAGQTTLAGQAQQETEEARRQADLQRYSELMGYQINPITGQTGGYTLAGRQQQINQQETAYERAMRLQLQREMTGFQGQESEYERQMRLQLQEGQQDWQTGESAADRAARLQLQESQQTWQSGESEQERDLRERLQSGQLNQQEAEFARSYILQQEASRRQQAELAGYMENGQLTEAGRAAREAETLRRGELAGQLEGGGLTEQARAAREQERLARAGMAAQLLSAPRDVFKAGAYFRSLNEPDPTGMGMGTGGIAGFNSFSDRVGAAPGTVSMADIDAQSAQIQAPGAGTPGTPGFGAQTQNASGANTLGGAGVPAGDATVGTGGMETPRAEAQQQTPGMGPGGPVEDWQSQFRDLLARSPAGVQGQNQDGGGQGYGAMIREALGGLGVGQGRGRGAERRRGQQSRRAREERGEQVGNGTNTAQALPQVLQQLIAQAQASAVPEAQVSAAPATAPAQTLQQLITQAQVSAAPATPAVPAIPAIPATPAAVAASPVSWRQQLGQLLGATPAAPAIPATPAMPLGGALPGGTVATMDMPDANTARMRELLGGTSDQQQQAYQMRLADLLGGQMPAPPTNLNLNNIDLSDAAARKAAQGDQQGYWSLNEQTGGYEFTPSQPGDNMTIDQVGGAAGLTPDQQQASQQTSANVSTGFGMGGTAGGTEVPQPQTMGPGNTGAAAANYGATDSMMSGVTPTDDAAKLIPGMSPGGPQGYDDGVGDNGLSGLGFDEPGGLGSYEPQDWEIGPYEPGPPGVEPGDPRYDEDFTDPRDPNWRPPRYDWTNPTKSVRPTDAYWLNPTDFPWDIETDESDFTYGSDTDPNAPEPSDPGDYQPPTGPNNPFDPGPAVPAPVAPAPVEERALTPGEISRWLVINRRRTELAKAGEPDVSASDLAELAKYQAMGQFQSPETMRYVDINSRDTRNREYGEAGITDAERAEAQAYRDTWGAPAPRALTAGEQARYNQIVETDARRRAAGESGVDLQDQLELRDYQIMMGQTPAPAPGEGGGGPGPGDPNLTPGSGMTPAPPAQTEPPPDDSNYGYLYDPNNNGGGPGGPQGDAASMVADGLGDLGIGAGGSFPDRAPPATNGATPLSAPVPYVDPEVLEDPDIQEMMADIKRQGRREDTAKRIARKQVGGLPGRGPGGPQGRVRDYLVGPVRFGEKDASRRAAADERYMRGLTRLNARGALPGAGPGGPVATAEWPTGAEATAPMPSMETPASVGASTFNQQAAGIPSVDPGRQAQAVGAFSDKLALGIGNWDPQELQRMSSTQRGIAEGATEALGLNWEDLEEAYAQTRFGNTGNALSA